MNELCSTCLCSGRKLSLINDSHYTIYSQIISEISIYKTDSTLLICWECSSMLRKWNKFKQRAQEVAIILSQQTPQTPITPAHPRLSLDPVQTYNYPDILENIKTEPDILIDKQDDFIPTVELMPTMDNELMPEDNELPVDNDVKDIYSSSDEMPLTFAYSFDLPKTRESDSSGTKRKSKKSKSKTKKLKSDKKSPSKLNQELTNDSLKTESELPDIEDHIFEESNEKPVNKDDMFEESNKPVNSVKELKHKCELCGMKFVRQKNLENHMMKHTGDGDAAKEPKPSAKPHCDICSKDFSTKKTYKYHMDVLHGGGGRYKCDRCPRVYLWRSNLTRHLTTHKAADSGELYCSLCNKKFASIATYRTHLSLSRRHRAENDMPFVCAECGARFVNKIRLRDHIDWDHLHKVKHRCELCNKPFKSHTSLYIHLTNVHRNKGRKDHLCHVCGKAYQNVCKLRGHVSACHGAAPAYRCDNCGAAFSWHSSWHRHCRQCNAKSPLKKVPKKSPNKQTDTPSDTQTMQQPFQ